jgi:hypothetical protein
MAAARSVFSVSAASFWRVLFPSIPVISIALMFAGGLPADVLRASWK